MLNKTDALDPGIIARLQNLHPEAVPVSALTGTGIDRLVESLSERLISDVSLVRLASTTSGRHVEVRAEVRALLSDAQGRARWHTISRATARGAARDRVMIQRDAVTAAARDVAKLVRSARP